MKILAFIICLTLMIMGAFPQVPLCLYEQGSGYAFSPCPTYPNVPMTTTTLPAGWHHTCMGDQGGLMVIMPCENITPGPGPTVTTTTTIIPGSTTTVPVTTTTTTTLPSTLLPEILTASPNPLTAGSGNIELTLTGSRFTNSSQFWAGRVGEGLEQKLVINFLNLGGGYVGQDRVRLWFQSQFTSSPGTVWVKVFNPNNGNFDDYPGWSAEFRINVQ